MYIGSAWAPVWGLRAAGGTAGGARLGCRMGTPWRGSGGHQPGRVQGQPLHHPSSVLLQPWGEPAAPGSRAQRRPERHSLGRGHCPLSCAVPGDSAITCARTVSSVLLVPLLRAWKE